MTAWYKFHKFMKSFFIKKTWHLRFFSWFFSWFLHFICLKRSTKNYPNPVFASKLIGSFGCNKIWMYFSTRISLIKEEEQITILYFASFQKVISTKTINYASVSLFFFSLSLCICLSVSFLKFSLLIISLLLFICFFINWE